VKGFLMIKAAPNPILNQAYIQSPLLNQFPSVVHAFCASGEAWGSTIDVFQPQGVRSSTPQKEACNLFARGYDFLSLNQVHGNHVQVVRTPYDLNALLAASGDGLITDALNLMIGVWTADCAPLLWISQDSAFMGVSHVGWRGLRAGIIQAMIKKFQELGVAPEMLSVAIGPTIAAHHYVVGETFLDYFTEVIYRGCFNREAGRLTFDLVKANIETLKVHGIERIDNMVRDTKEGPFCSFRFSREQGLPTEGRNLSFLAHNVL
jgi:YfiH family protein